MPLVLSDHDLAELNLFLMRECRGIEISAVQEWVNRKRQIQMAALEKKKAEAPTNGHDANPYQAQA